MNSKFSHGHFANKVLFQNKMAVKLVMKNVLGRLTKCHQKYLTYLYFVCFVN